MIEYKKLTSDSLKDIKALYRQHGWMAYLNDDEKLTRAFENSLISFGDQTKKKRK